MSHGLTGVTTEIPRQHSKGLTRHPDKNQPHTSSRHRNPQKPREQITGAGQNVLLWQRLNFLRLKNWSCSHRLQEGRIIILGISKSSEHRWKNSLGYNANLLVLISLEFRSLCVCLPREENKSTFSL